MTFQEFTGLLEALAALLHCDVAYSFFQDGVRRKRFLLYELPESDDVYADGVNYVNIENVNLEFYSPTREFNSERIINEFLKENKITFSKNATYISTEKVHLTTYELEVLINAESNSEQT